MASYLKRYLDNPGKSIDLVETVVQKLSDKIDLSGYEANALKLVEITKVIEKLNEKEIDIPDELRRLKSSLSLEIYDQEKSIKKLEGMELRLTEVLEGLRTRLTKNGHSVKNRRLKKRYVHETSPKLLQKEMRKALRELGGSGRKKDVIEIVRRNLDGKFKKNDQLKKNGVALWIFNISKERGFMMSFALIRLN
ncbi:MAG: hypothetical protein HOK24_23850 [Desulfobacula sp.]|jgi:hypothetical protein|uniref:hypothetical protein n=1 Tax=Desulfobacula sp. TaxID=2593537 RepID=UPI001D63B7E6|nr:hypothetical protein [Desulfobacula sp.]MBT4876096.1 hypothetical protein [Desulfobacula sp.]MBT5547475.1 hypothetical protein [Desulfobacula sp.]